MTIEERLFELQDLHYRDFHRGLVPTAADDYIIGVRMPTLRALAKEIEPEPFLAPLPHRYYEENQLHAILLSGMKDYDLCLREVERFLPYVDNWATCDGLRPRCFAKHTDDLLTHVQRWLASEHEYTVRFGIKMLMEHYLDDAFAPQYPETVAGIHRDEYYIKMMQAWYFATALAKQYDAILPFLQKNRLEEWTHQKTIQKAIESYRINDEQKAELRKLRRKG